MRDETDFSTPEKVLWAFCTAMCHWEREALRALPNPEDDAAWRRYWEQINASWRPIFDKYCTPRKRVYGQRRYSVGTPTQYQPRAERILEVSYKSPYRVVISTERTKGFEGIYQYVLVRRGGRWLVDNRKKIDPDGKIRRLDL